MSHWLDVERPDHPLQRLVMLAHASGDRQAVETAVRAVRVEKYRLRETQLRAERERRRVAAFTQRQIKKAEQMLAGKES